MSDGENTNLINNDNKDAHNDKEIKKEDIVEVKDGEHKVDGEKKDDKPVEEEKKSTTANILSTLSFGDHIIAGIFEFFGTFLFLTAILLGSGPEATIMSFWIIITMIAPFSGGHVNPAVSFGFYIYDLNICSGLLKLIYYWIAQVAGGFLALLFAVQVKEKVEIIIFKHAVQYPEFVTEAFFTGTFIFVILYVCSKTTGFSDNRALKCVVIATWLYYAATSAGKRSVGALNPAVLICFAIYNAHVKENYYEQHKDDIWMTLGAHFGGALVFAILFFIVEKAFPDSEKKVEVVKQEEEKKDVNKA